MATGKNYIMGSGAEHLPCRYFMHPRSEVPVKPFTPVTQTFDVCFTTVNNTPFCLVTKDW